MAVGAHELALRDFVQNQLLVVAAPQCPDITDLLGSGKVVPLHSDWRKGSSAVRTRLADLEGDVPLLEREMQCPLLLQPPPLVALVIRGIEGLTARLAPELTATLGASMELILRLLPAASGTPFHCPESTVKAVPVQQVFRNCYSSK
jgi:hypothetical protein